MAPKKRRRPEQATDTWKRLKPARKAFGLRACEAADEVGVSAPTWSDWENGFKPPNGENAALLEAWSAKHALRLSQPDLVIRATDWLASDVRERIAALSPEAA